MGAGQKSNIFPSYFLVTQYENYEHLTHHTDWNLNPPKPHPT